jgi:hypothetical protein
MDHLISEALSLTKRVSVDCTREECGTRQMQYAPQNGLVRKLGEKRCRSAD